MKQILAIFLLSTFILTGCTTTSSKQASMDTEIGTVIGVRSFLFTDTNDNSVVHETNKGNSKKTETVASELRNSDIQKNTYINMVELTIQESNHNLIKITQPANYSYFVGQHVSVVKQGQKAQVNPQ